MKISAKELIKLIAQGGPNDLLPGQQWDVSEEDIQRMIDEGVGLEPSGAGNLERAFEGAGSPQRLRIIDPEGSLYDVFIVEQTADGAQVIGVTPLELKIIYPRGWDKYTSWDEAEATLPKGWEVYESIGGQQQQQTASVGKKWLLISSKGDKIQILRVLDEQDWD